MKRKEIKLDGETYTLSPITLNNLVELEEQKVDPESMSGIRYLLYLALVKDKPAMTPETVGELVTMENIGEINEALVGSLNELEGDTPKGKVARRKLKTA